MIGFAGGTMRAGIGLWLVIGCARDANDADGAGGAGGASEQVDAAPEVGADGGTGGGFLSDPPSLPREFAWQEPEMGGIWPVPLHTYIDTGLPVDSTGGRGPDSEVVAARDGTRLYVGNDTGRLVALDLAVPEAPRALAETWLEAGPLALEVLGDTLVAVENFSPVPPFGLRLSAFDLGDVDTMLGTFAPPTVTELPGQAYTTFRVGDRLLVVSVEQVSEDFELRTVLRSFGRIESGAVASGAPLTLPIVAQSGPRLALHGSTLWAAAIESGTWEEGWQTRFTPFDAGHPDLPPHATLPDFLVPGVVVDSSSVSVDDDGVSCLTWDMAAVDDGSSVIRFQRVRTSTPVAEHLADIEWAGVAWYAGLAGRRAYLWKDGSFQVLDLSVAGAPRVGGQVASAPLGWAIATGDRLIALIETSRLEFELVVLDASDAANPHFLGPPRALRADGAPIALPRLQIVDGEVFLTMGSTACPETGTWIARLDEAALVDPAPLSLSRVDVPYGRLLPWSPAHQVSVGSTTGLVSWEGEASPRVRGSVELWQPGASMVSMPGGLLARLKPEGGRATVEFLESAQLGASPVAAYVSDLVWGDCSPSSIPTGWLGVAAGGLLVEVGTSPRETSPVDIEWLAPGSLREAASQARLEWSDRFLPVGKRVVTPRGYASLAYEYRPDAQDGDDALVVLDVDVVRDPASRIKTFPYTAFDLAGWPPNPLLGDADQLVTSHWVPDGARVRYFLDRFDLARPGDPEPQPPRNVPGRVLAYDHAAGRVLVAEYVHRFENAPDEAACLVRLGPDARFANGRCARGDTHLHTVGIDGDIRILATAEVSGFFVDGGRVEQGRFAGPRRRVDGRISAVFVIEDWRSGQTLEVEEVAVPKGAPDVRRFDLIGGHAVLTEKGLVIVDLRTRPYTRRVVPMWASPGVEGDERGLFLSLGRGGVRFVPFN